MQAKVELPCGCKSFDAEVWLCDVHDRAYREAVVAGEMANRFPRLLKLA